MGPATTRYPAVEDEWDEFGQQGQQKKGSTQPDKD
jgi:hypothetical protein